MTKRTRLAPEARRAQLIDLGLQMLATRRLDELSVDLIATAAGISRGLLFHYFPSTHDYHVAVARAAAAEMLRRTEPDAALPAVDALRAGLTAYVDYVEENPGNYKSLVRGAASGDAAMRTIFDETRTTLAGRILDIFATQGLAAGPRVTLAVHGWIAYVEECVVRWIDAGMIERDQLLELLTKSLPALTLAAADEEVGTLVSILTNERAIGDERPHASVARSS